MSVTSHSCRSDANCERWGISCHDGCNHDIL